MSYEQKDFFMKALDLSDKESPEEWVIIVLSHFPLDFLGGDYNKGSDLKAILKAYDEGSSVSITVDSSYASAQNEADKYSGTLDYDYSGKNSAKVVNIHGHTHTNKYGKLKFIDDNTELNIMRIATPNSSFTENCSTDRYTEYGDYSITEEEANKIKKVANTKADTSATFYFFDLDGQIVYSVGYALDSVTVTMGGVDVTATTYTDGVINIAEVTGDIVITAIAKDNYVPVWDIGSRTAVTDLYATASDEKDLSRKCYYYGACATGLIDYTSVSNVSVEGNDVTFTSNANAFGIGLPYHLESGASYTFACTASAKARLRKLCYYTDGTSISGSEEYSSSGTSLSLTFTAPTDETQWVMLILDTHTDSANTSITYTNITLTKN